MVTPTRIANGSIGPDCPCFIIIAEAGVDHNGDQELARQLVDAAAASGADAAKFQTFPAERILTPDAPPSLLNLQRP